MSNITLPADQVLAMDAAFKAALELGGFRFNTLAGPFSVATLLNNVSTYIDGGSETTFTSTDPDGATAVAVKIDTSTAWANAEAKLLQLKNNGVEKSYFDKDGVFVGKSSGILDIPDVTGIINFKSNNGYLYPTTLRTYFIGGPAGVVFADGQYGSAARTDGASFFVGDDAGMGFFGGDGAALLPSHSFKGDVTAGLYRPAGAIGLTGVAGALSSPSIYGPVTISALATPVNGAHTTATVSGTLADGTYWYRVAALSGTGTTLASTETSIVVPAGTNTNIVTVKWGAVPGATSYKVYGRATGAELYMATVPAGTLEWVDDGTVTPDGALPAENTANTITVDKLIATGTITLGADSHTGTDGILKSPGGQTVLNLYDTGFQINASPSLITLNKTTGVSTFAQNNFVIDSKAQILVGGADANYADIGGWLNVQTTTVGNVGVGEDTLMTYNVAANAMNVTGRGYRWKLMGQIANNVNAKTLKIYFGSQIISVAFGTNVAANWFAEVNVYRTAPNAQKYAVEVRVVDAGTNLVSGVYMAQGTLTETEGNVIVAKATAEATNDNDVTQTMTTFEVF